MTGAKAHFEAAKETDGGYLRPSKRCVVDVFVTRDLLDHALQVANSIFFALEDRGHKVTLSPKNVHLFRPEVDERIEPKPERYGRRRWNPDRPTVVFIGTVGIGLSLFELTEEVEVQYVNGKYLRHSEVAALPRRRVRGHEWTTTHDLPTGRLALRASSPYLVAKWERQWRESAPGSLEQMVPKIVRELETEAVTIAKMVEDGERQAEVEQRRWQEEHERWLRKEEERRRTERIKESKEQLLLIIDQWATVKRIEEFFADAEHRATILTDLEREQVLDRLHRGREILGSQDALRHFRGWKSPNES